MQARACAPYVRGAEGVGAAGELEVAAGATIADGIAMKRPGDAHAAAAARAARRAIETVTEDEIADAMVFLAERAKLVAEGAGAVAVAALLERAPRARSRGTTVAIVSGGNVDSGLLAGLLRRHETEEGRRVRIFTRVPDRPGGLAELLSLIAARPREPGERRARARGGAAARARDGRRADARDARPGAHRRRCSPRCARGLRRRLA